MSMRWLKACTLTAVVAGAFGVTAVGADDKKEEKKDGLTPVPTVPATGAAGVVTGDCGHGGWVAPAPTYQTITVTELVPTHVQEARTVYKPVTRQEAYTAYRTEYAHEVRTRNVTVNQLVHETVNETRQVSRPVTETVLQTRTVSERVPVTKTVTVNETHWSTVQVTEMRTRTVSHTVSVPTCEVKGPSLMDRFKGFRDPCYCPCPRTVTGCKKERVCETVCEPVTVCKKVATCVPCTKQVCCYETVCRTVQVPVCVTRHVCETITVPVCRTRCVPVTKCEQYTVCVPKCVAVPCTRNVCTTEACQELVTVCKLVPTQVQKQVLVAAPCGNGCGNGCGSPCDTGCGHNACDPCAKAKWGGSIKGKLTGLFSRFGGKFKGGCGCSAGYSAPAASCGGCG